MLRCKDNTIYTGITKDLKRRFEEHKNKTKKCAKYTYFHDVISIEAAWECENRIMASKLECYIKRLNKSQKEQIICKGTKLSDIVIMVEDKDYVRVKDSNITGIQR